MNLKTYLKSGLFILAFLPLIFPAIASAAASFFTEDFEAAFTNGAPPGWTKSYKTTDSPVDWFQRDGDYWVGDTAHGGYYNATLYSSLSGDHETYLITPAITFPADTPAAAVQFWHKQRNYAGAQDTLKVYYGTNSAGPWEILTEYNSDVSDWTRHTLAIPDPAGKTYYIAFLGNARDARGVCIDDVNVFEGAGDVIPHGNTQSDYYAVICGVSDYLYVSDLKYCDNDARDLGNALVASGTWKNENITVLVDSAASKNAIQGAIQDMADKADENDVCLFFFSGHGTTGPDVGYPDEADDLDEYLVPYDSDPSSYDYDIRDDELAEWLGALHTDNYVVILDTCFSGGQIKGLASLPDAGSAGKGLGALVGQKGDGFAADFMPPIGVKDLQDNARGVVITSCDDTEESMENDALQNGVFTYYLVQGLKGPADANDDSAISAEECYDYLNPLATAFNSLQHAQLYDADPAQDLYLVITNPYIKKITVKGGVTDLNDSIKIQGEISASVSDINTASSVELDLGAADMNYIIYNFPIDANTFKKGKFASTLKDGASKMTFKFNPKTYKFTFSATKVDLTGLSCPLTLRISIGDYTAIMQADETVVNGKKPIPINLLMGFGDSIRVDKLRYKHASAVDTLSVKGGFSVLDTDANLVDTNFIASLNDQPFTVPAGLFTAKKSKYSCKKAPVTEGGVTNAVFDFGKGSFTLTIKASPITAEHAENNLFGLQFPVYDYNEVDEFYIK